jgi:hypothetical protein
MDPYTCCYCGVTKQTQKQIVEHTIQEHPTNEVKLRKCGLSTSTGKCGYRTLNFKIIPSELESLGKKVCVDDHGSAFIILFYNMTLIAAFCPKFPQKYDKKFLKDPVIGKLLPALE